MSAMSRRGFIGTGLVAGAAVVVPRKLRALPLLANSQERVTSVDRMLLSSRAADAESLPAMNRLFSNLLDDPGFRQLSPVAFLVTNASNTSIRAFSTHWTFSTPNYSHEVSLMHYFHPRAGFMGRKRMHWGTTGNRTRFTGRIPIIKSGSTRLVTPFFNWGSSYYADHGIPNWTKLLHRRARPEVSLADLSRPDASVSMRVVAAITHNYTVVGPENDALARVFATTRNAEHDEALSILERVRSGDSPEAIGKLLQSHASGLAFDIRPDTDLYYRVRQRQAKVLLRRYSKARWDQFTRTLQSLRNRPKTILRLV